MSIRDKRVGFVGGGNMGEALIRGLTKTGLMPVGHLIMADVRTDRLEEMKRLYGVSVAEDNLTLVRRADVDPSGREAADPRRRVGRDRPCHARKAPDLGGRRRVHQ